MHRLYSFFFFLLEANDSTSVNVSFAYMHVCLLLFFFLYGTACREILLLHTCTTRTSWRAKEVPVHSQIIKREGGVGGGDPVSSSAITQARKEGLFCLLQGLFRSRHM